MKGHFFHSLIWTFVPLPLKSGNPLTKGKWSHGWSWLIWSFGVFPQHQKDLLANLPLSWARIQLGWGRRPFLPLRVDRFGRRRVGKTGATTTTTTTATSHLGASQTAQAEVCELCVRYSLDCGWCSPRFIFWSRTRVISSCSGSFRRPFCVTNVLPNAASVQLRECE